MKICSIFESVCTRLLTGERGVYPDARAKAYIASRNHSSKKLKIISQTEKDKSFQEPFTILLHAISDKLL